MTKGTKVQHPLGNGVRSLLISSVLLIAKALGAFASREFPVGAIFCFHRQNSHIKIPKFLPQPPIPAVLATPTVAWLYQLY